MVSFFFNDTATTEIYTLSLHDALPICRRPAPGLRALRGCRGLAGPGTWAAQGLSPVDAPAGLPHPLAKALEQRSEEHTSELQSHLNLVCRLILEKKKQIIINSITYVR